MKNNIGTLRKKKGLSMRELADLAGTSQQQIDRLEKAQRRLTAEWMEKLSQALSCKPGELIDFSAAEKPETKIKTALARVLGAIQTGFSNSVHEFAPDEQYEISFRPGKKDFGKKFFALIVEGGAFRNYPENSELIFAQTRISEIGRAALKENAGDFISSKAGKSNSFRFEIGGKLVEGNLVKSIRSE
jgi:transcriptional regulator with XRE-family HTH domain